MEFEVSASFGLLLVVLFIAFGPVLPSLCCLAGALVAGSLFLMSPNLSLVSLLCAGVAVSLLPLSWSLLGEFYETTFLGGEGGKVLRNFLPIIALVYLSHELADGSLLSSVASTLLASDMELGVVTFLHLVAASIKWVVFISFCYSFVMFSWSWAISLTYHGRDSDVSTTVYHLSLVPLAILAFAVTADVALQYSITSLLNFERMTP